MLCGMYESLLRWILENNMGRQFQSIKRVQTRSMSWSRMLFRWTFEHSGMSRWGKNALPLERTWVLHFLKRAIDTIQLSEISAEPSRVVGSLRLCSVPRPIHNSDRYVLLTTALRISETVWMCLYANLDKSFSEMRTVKLGRETVYRDLPFDALWRNVVNARQCIRESTKIS